MYPALDGSPNFISICMVVREYIRLSSLKKEKFMNVTQLLISLLILSILTLIAIFFKIIKINLICFSLLLIFFGLLLSFFNNIGSTFNNRVKLADEIIKMKSDIDFKKFDNPNLRKMILYMIDQNDAISMKHFKESDRIKIQKHYVSGQLVGAIHLCKVRHLENYTDIVPVARLCGFDELKRWAENDKTLKWIAWSIALTGFIIQVLIYVKKNIL